MPLSICRFYGIWSKRASQVLQISRIGRRLLCTTGETLREGDRALLRHVPYGEYLTKPLHTGGATMTAHGLISHDSIIGTRIQDFVKSTKGVPFRVYQPTLEEYVTMTPRKVTPIYPKDANLIVSLLDIHASPQTPSAIDNPVFEILEAGTGHGSLTLHLARAIHAANPPSSNATNVVDETLEEERSTSIPISSSAIDEPGKPIDLLSDIAQDRSKPSQTGETRPRRNAVIHSLDVSPEYLEHARKTVLGFRRGQYANDIDFHASDVSAWIDQQISLRGLDRPEVKDKAFLSHIILDLPDSNFYLKKAASVLNVNGSLLLFSPSITQIVDCVKETRELGMLLKLESVLELGPAISRGREWDVRTVFPRAWTRAESERITDVVKTEASRIMANEVNVTTNDEAFNTKTLNQEAIEARVGKRRQPEIVCRPRVGNKIAGGAFLGFWRKLRHEKKDSKLPTPGPPSSNSADNIQSPKEMDS